MRRICNRQSIERRSTQRFVLRRERSLIRVSRRSGNTLTGFAALASPLLVEGLKRTHIVFVS